MSSFEKLRCAFDENFVRCAHWRLCNANSSAAVELFARNGTLPEPHLRINGVHLKTLHSIDAGKSWKISSFLLNILNLQGNCSRFLIVAVAIINL